MLYEIRVSANKGLGLFAKRQIPRGTLILAEKPLLSLLPGQRPSDILSHAKRLPKKRREELLALSWDAGGGVKRVGRWGEVLGWTVSDWVGSGGEVVGVVGEERENSKSVVKGKVLSGLFTAMNEGFRILSIFRSNSFNLASGSPKTTTTTTAATKSASSPLNRSSSPNATPPYELALFPTIARINHSCLPSAQANYHPLQRTFNVYATRDIPVGEEVSINYLPEHGQLRDQRVAKLEEGYGFTCTCAACDLSTLRGAQGEHGRKRMQERIRIARAYVGAGAGEVVDAGYGPDGMLEVLVDSVPEDVRARIEGLKHMSEGERDVWIRDSERALLRHMLGVYAVDGVVGREVASMYYHLARLDWESGDGERAVKSAEVGLRLERDCLGVDHPGYVDAVAFVKGLRRNSGGGVWEDFPQALDY